MAKNTVGTNETSSETANSTEATQNTSLSQNKYMSTQKYQDQQKLMKQITNIYNNDKLDPKKKVMMFTSEVCLPEILKQQDVQEKNADAESQEVFLTIQNEKD